MQTHNIRAIEQHRKYNRSKSSSHLSIPKQHIELFNIKYGTGKVSGIVSVDTITVFYLVFVYNYLLLSFYRYMSISISSHT